MNDPLDANRRLTYKQIGGSPEACVEDILKRENTNIPTRIIIIIILLSPPASIIYRQQSVERLTARGG